MKLAVLGESFKRGDLAFDGGGGGDTRSHRRAVYDYGTQPALAKATTKARTLQSKIVAQNVEQGSGWVDIQRVHLAVDVQGEVAHNGPNFSRWYAAGEAKWVLKNLNYAWTVILSRVRTFTA